VSEENKKRESEQASNREAEREANEQDKQQEEPKEDSSAQTDGEVHVEPSGKATPNKDAAERALENQNPAAEAKAEKHEEADKAAKAEKPDNAEKPEKKASEQAADGDDEAAAKKKAAAEARAARAAERAKKKAEEEEKPKEPSPKQPVLDRLVDILKEHAGADAIEEAYVNEASRHLPTVIVKADFWTEVATILRDHAELKLHYLRNVTGVDRETHMEVIYQLINLETKQDYAVKVKTDRDQPAVPSATPVWSTANWPEREIYDLLGVDFPGHPDLRRIMMADDWEGYPLRKDYSPADPEV